MRKLTITFSVSTELDDQEIIDMMVDGFIDKAGNINAVSVNGRKLEINDSVFTIGLRAGESDMGTGATSKAKRIPLPGEHSECDGVGKEGPGEKV